MKTRLIITGGATGLGKALALSYASNLGANLQICIADINAERAATTISELQALKADAFFYACDVTKQADVKGLYDIIQTKWQGVDIVINNAGILRDTIFHKMEPSDWNNVISVHLNGSFYVSRAAAPYFREQNSGAFVHMTSTSGLIGNFGQANYSAAKLGIAGLSKSICLDMSRYNVRSNCIAPFAWSRMTNSIPSNTAAEKERVERLKKMTPETNAPLAVFLASEAAKNVSGQIFSARLNELFIYNQNRPVKSVHSASGWTPRQIAERALPSFKNLMTPNERSGDVFSWDPI